MTYKTLQPIQTVNLNDAVYDILRQQILDYNFEPGQRLDLVALEDELQVSRTPLKNALTRLSVEGLIEIQPRRGTFVAPLDADRLEEAFKIRSSFELYVALCIFKYLRQEDYDFFDDLEHEMNILVDEANHNWLSILPDYFRLDRELHEHLVRRGGPPKMLELFEQTNVHSHVQRIARHYSHNQFVAMHFEHGQIFAAIREQSPERLNAVLLNHLEASRIRAVQVAHYLKTHPDVPAHKISIDEFSL